MKQVLLALIAVASVVSISSCEKYEDGRPEKGVINEFNDMYPDAHDIDWDRTYDGWEVSFETGRHQNEVDHTAWYDLEGNWIQTVSEILIVNVPEHIRSILAADPVYGSAVFEDDDVDYVQRPDEEFYIFDLYLDGREVDVKVYADGTVTPGNIH